MERFSQRARRVLSLAQEAAISLQHHQIRPEHLLLGLMREEGGAAGRALRNLGLDTRRVEEQVRRISTDDETRPDAQFDLSAGTKQVLELAVNEARRLQQNYICTEHLLLGLLRPPEGVAVDILQELNIQPEQVRQQVAAVMQEQPPPATRSAAPGSSRPAISSNIEYFLLRTTSRSSGQISHLPVDLSPDVKAALEEALKEVGHSDSLLLDERHLLLGLLQNRAGALSRILLEAGIELDELILRLRRPGDS